MKQNTTIQSLEINENHGHVMPIYTQDNHELSTKKYCSAVKLFIALFLAVLSNICFIYSLIKEFSYIGYSSNYFLLGKFPCVLFLIVFLIIYCINLLIIFNSWYKNSIMSKYLYIGMIFILGLFYIALARFYALFLRKHFIKEDVRFY